MYMYVYIYEFIFLSSFELWDVLQFEYSYLIEIVVERNELRVMPCSIRVSQDDELCELYVVDAVNSNIF